MGLASALLALNQVVLVSVREYSRSSIVIKRTRRTEDHLSPVQVEPLHGMDRTHLVEGLRSLWPGLVRLGNVAIPAHDRGRARPEV